MESHREAEVVASVAVREVVCEDCSRTFRRESDCKRHKCIAERRKPHAVWVRLALKCAYTLLYLCTFLKCVHFVCFLVMSRGNISLTIYYVCIQGYAFPLITMSF